MTETDELRRELGQLADDTKSRLEQSRANGDRRAYDFFRGASEAYRFVLEIGLAGGRP